MQREIHVYIDVSNSAVLVGRLWTRERSGKTSASFTYDDAWRRRPGAFALSPALPLSPGQFNTNRPLFIAFTDAAPDSWGMKVMRRYERMRSEVEGREPRTWSDVDFLARVDDRTRIGALRFKDANGDSFLTTENKPVPPLMDLPVLLGASDRIDRGRGSNKDVAMVLAPGTSLGGARPKATVRDQNGQLLVAKFPKRDDDWPVTRWEATTLALAKEAGVVVPERFFWKAIKGKAVLFLGRFDRTDANFRIPYMSAMSALDATDHDEDRSYLELAEVIRQQGSMPGADLKQLWRRIVFNILVSNTDDHLRNHAFLRDGNGWRLSPAFDMNPCPVDVKKRIHALAIDELDHNASLETALAVGLQFGLTNKEALSIAAEVGGAVARWREVAKIHKLAPGEINRMSSAFEHDDLRQATRGVVKISMTGAKKPKKKTNKRPNSTISHGAN
jgi:serine/threonine-protein kinase HipA